MRDQKPIELCLVSLPKPELKNDEFSAATEYEKKANESVKKFPQKAAMPLDYKKTQLGWGFNMDFIPMSELSTPFK